LGKLASSPQALAVVALQFAVGFGLGYVAAKALKYVLAFAALLVLGSALSLWSVGKSPESLLESAKQLLAAAKELAVVLGIMTVAPVTAGFVVGAVVGLLRK